MIILMLFLKHTQSIRTVEPEILHGAMIYFAYVTGNSVQEHSIRLMWLLSISDCYSRDK